MQEEIPLFIQYIYQQWERAQKEQRNLFPKLAYTDTVAFEQSESYQDIKHLSVNMMRDMTAYKREQLLIQIEGLHQHMQNIVSAVLKTI
ncbi:hypothetical protein CN345_01865 [Bacillus thuringiensis]|nr:hypothetical protein CN488_29935 [Bacillus anthracis]PEZ46190.1 hypothetical protein CN345_01865 [Bacillus thuringiensis]PGY62165.1 hypothetical protein COE09_05675 [Bacillus thuringiensis]